MNKAELIQKLKETMQTEKDISVDTRLEEIPEWDSLSTLAIVSLFDSLFKVLINFNIVSKCNTVGDLLKIVESKLE